MASALVRNRKYFLVIFMSIFLLSLFGCSMFYYGHTKEEWIALSESEKRAAKEEYQRVRETKKQQEEKTAIDERAESFEDYGIKKTIP